jgi:TonB family protein
LKQIAPIEHNLNIIATTWVIADLDIGSDGHVRFATALKGEEPLRGIVVSNATRWNFLPARMTTPVESHVTAVFLFRPREIFSSPAPDLSGMSVAGLDRPPIPVSLSDPGYPAASIAEGEVVLELRLSETGSIQNVRVVKGIPGLTEFTRQAVRSWRFVPALRKGTPVPGTVIAVISYLRPLVL